VNRNVVFCVPFHLQHLQTERRNFMKTMKTVANRTALRAAKAETRLAKAEAKLAKAEAKLEARKAKLAAAKKIYEAATAEAERIGVYSQEASVV
jgi:hypothetical protein